MINKATDTRQVKILTYIALAFVIVGVLFCWFPILGIAHAIAGTILATSAYRLSAQRINLYTILVGIIASITSAILTIIELNNIELVNSYNATPWL